MLIPNTINALCQFSNRMTLRSRVLHKLKIINKNIKLNGVAIIQMKEPSLSQLRQNIPRYIFYGYSIGSNIR